MKESISLGRYNNYATCHIELVSDEKENRLVDYIFNIDQLKELLETSCWKIDILKDIFTNRVVRFNRIYDTVKDVTVVSARVDGDQHNDHLHAVIRLRFPNTKSEINKFTNYLIQYFDPEDDSVLYWLYQAVRCARAARHDIMESAYMDDGILDKGGQKYIDYVKRLLGEALKALTISDEDFKKRVDDILKKHKTTLDEVTIDNKIIRI